MKRKRVGKVALILAGAVVAVPCLLWSGYAVLALLRHEHFYHGLPSSWWRRQLTLMAPEWTPNGDVEVGRYAKFAGKLSASRFAPVTEYLGLSLGSVGGPYKDPAAAGVLCDLVRDSENEYLHVCAAHYLSMMHLHPEVVVPALSDVLQQDRPRTDPYRLYRSLAMSSLERYGPEAKTAVPVLLDCLYRKAKPPDWDAQNERLNAARVLCQIEPENIDRFIRMLEHPDPEIRGYAVSTLSSRFGPKAKAAVPALLKMYGGKDPNAKRAAAQTLLRIDPEAAYRSGVPKGYH
jgi:hypothetical protein